MIATAPKWWERLLGHIMSSVDYGGHHGLLKPCMTSS